MERNPYYWAVDPAGNQLPYLDELYRFMDFDDEVIRLKALAGEVDIARVNVQTYILAKETFDTFPEFLDSVHFILEHYRITSFLSVLVRCYLLVNFIIPGDVGHQILDQREGFHWLHSQGFIIRIIR